MVNLAVSLSRIIYSKKEIPPIHQNTGDYKLPSVFCLKAIGAFFVVCIHCYEPWQIFPIIRTAVPFFFMISGFFCYKGDSETSLNACIKALKKILWITLYANIFYYISVCFPVNAFPIHSIKTFLKFIFIGDILGDHLWYLNAYIEVLITVILAIKYHILKWLWAAIPIGWILGLILGKYEFLFPDLPNDLILSRNFFTTGIPCFGMAFKRISH